MSPTVADIRDADGDPPLVMITAYDAPTASIAAAAGVDILLVGDSLGNAVLGYESTLPVTIDEIASHTAAVVRGAPSALVVADMPFLSFGVDESDTIHNAGRLLADAGADAVKLECGPHTVELTNRLVDLGIPVMAHLGLLPQHVNQVGGYHQQGTDAATADRIQQLAIEHANAGAFAVVLEHVPDSLAETITADLSIPTIGIGAGPSCTGQVLVFTDVVGISETVPPFAQSFGDGRSVLLDAVSAYASAVREGSFPDAEED